MKKRRLLALLLAGALVLALFGCGGVTMEDESSKTPDDASTSEDAGSSDAASSDAADPSSMTIGIAVHGYNEYGATLADCSQAALEAKGFNVKLLNGEWSAETQIGQVENLVAEGVDGVLLFPVDADASVPCAEDLYEAGIPCIVVNTGVNTDHITAFVGPPNKEVGGQVMSWVAEKMGGKGNLVWLQGTLGVSSQIERSEGIQAVLDENPDIKLLEKDAANWARDEGLAKMENWLLSHGDAINAVVAENDEMALGALQAIEDAGLAGKIIIGAIDGIEDACIAIKDGKYDVTFFQDAQGQGDKAAELMYQILIDKQEPTETEYWVPFQEVNADNADDYLS